MEIPLRTTSSGFLSGEVRLDGIAKPQNFIIDTGASISVVSEKLAELEEMANYITPTRMRVFGAAGIAEDVKTLLLPRVMLGALYPGKDQCRCARFGAGKRNRRIYAGWNPWR